MTHIAPQSSPRTVVAPGTVLGDRYEVLDFIGEGGFATVYRARDRRDGRIVALKLLDGDSQLMDMRTYRARFFREAEIAARIDHPNVVRIFNYGVAGHSELPFLAMELLEGHDLEHEIQCFGALEPARAVRLFLPVLDALARGHALGIIHRDLKPANLFLCDPHGPAERLVVLDFGVARLDDKTAARLTATGQLFGTPVFAAPEWIRQQISTPALDVYQIGLILVEALSGEPVIREDNPFECLNIHCQGRLELPVDLLYGPMANVFSRALALDHEVRFAHAGELRDALSAVDLTQLPTRISPGPRRRLVQPPGSRIPVDVHANVTAEIDGDEDDTPHFSNRSRNLAIAALLAAIVLGLATYLLVTSGQDSADARAAVTARSLSEPLTPRDLGKLAAHAVANANAHGITGRAFPIAVVVESRPSGARVFRGGVAVGQTPYVVGFQTPDAARVTLRLEREGFRDQTVEVGPGDGPQHIERLERKPRRRSDRPDDKSAAGDGVQGLPIMP